MPLDLQRRPSTQKRDTCQQRLKSCRQAQCSRLRRRTPWHEPFLPMGLVRYVKAVGCSRLISLRLLFVLIPTCGSRRMTRSLTVDRYHPSCSAWLPQIWVVEATTNRPTPKGACSIFDAVCGRECVKLSRK